MKRIGIRVSTSPKMGDKIQFTSMPENYYLATGQKLIDVDKDWIFDFNPYVDRDTTPDVVIDLWHEYVFKYPRKRLYYTSLAERNAMFLEVPAKLTHPRLYRFENEPIRHHTTIAPFGSTNAQINPKILQHILATRKGVAQVGLSSEPSIGAEYDLRTTHIWDAVYAIASSSEFIGNSGLSLIASCYPRVWNKMVLTQFSEEDLKDYLGMECGNHFTHWHDHRYSYYNKFDYDIGISLSYLKI